MKSRKQIEHLFKAGKTVSAQPLRLYYIVQPLPEGACSLQFGVAVGTKHFKRAVQRNRVKRLIREAWRLQKNSLQQQLQQSQLQMQVFVLYTAKELPSYQLIYEKTTIALQKLEELRVQSAS